MSTSTGSSDASVEDRQSIGERVRVETPLSSQAEWVPATDRPDPVELLIDQNATREADLVPVRHGRMTVSPFTFYRGAAKVMATDLATTLTGGLTVQLCGYAHLSNFGLFASPERHLLFGLNDFDETLPGPFEYDLKRMAASFTIAARTNGFKFAEVVDGRHRIVSRPPVIIPLRDLAAGYEMTPEEARNTVEEQFGVYKATLSDNRRLLLDRFTIVDMARKVVGVGSVGTRAFMVLLKGRHSSDLVFLQLKEATRSVLEDHLPKSRYATAGQRVVEGQRLMQAASDIFLGWTGGVFEANRYYYWRQLRDMKGTALVERMSPFGMRFYARMCGWTLSRAHARSGDPIAIAEYLGTDSTMDNAIADLSIRYADQNQRDYDSFVEAISNGRIQAVTGI